MLYKIPVFNDVQYSCMSCCTLVCFAVICRIKVWMYIILVGVLYLILMYTSIATPFASVSLSLSPAVSRKTCKEPMTVFRRENATEEEKRGAEKTAFVERHAVKMSNK